MAKSKLNQYTVTAKLALDVSVDVRAENLEEAVSIAQGMVVGDFVSFRGDHNDSAIVIDGVWTFNPVPRL